MEDYKTGEDLIVKKSGDGGIRYLHSHIPTFAQVGIQAEGTKKSSTCKHSIK
jgi:hypothetical protein